MKKLTEEEFHDRVQAVQRAMDIFGEMTNGHITRAFQAYQAIFADREREIFISTQSGGRRPHTLLDRYERPACPDCGHDMLLRQLPPNDENILTEWCCSNTELCGIILETPYSIHEWMVMLKRKDKDEPDGNDEDIQAP